MARAQQNRALGDLRDKLVYAINVSTALSYFQAHNHFNDDEAALVNRETTRTAQAITLFKLLETKDSSGWELLLDYLESSQQSELKKALVEKYHDLSCTVKVSLNVTQIDERELDIEPQAFAIGTSASIHRATWKYHINPIAVKFLLKDVRPSANRALINEVSIAYALRQSNIIKIFGMVSMQASGKAGIVMELANHGSLEEKMLDTSAAPLSDAAKATICLGICNGIDYLHSRKPKIVHRDIKPANVLLASTSSGGSYMAKIIDFDGSAFLSDEGLSKLSIRKGTTKYMAPELTADNCTHDHRVDIYSFAVLMYELFSGVQFETALELPKLNDLAVIAAVRSSRRPEEFGNVATPLHEPIKLGWETNRELRPSLATIWRALHEVFVTSGDDGGATEPKGVDDGLDGSASGDTMAKVEDGPEYEWISLHRGDRLPAGAIMAFDRSLKNNEPLDYRVAYVARWQQNDATIFGRAHVVNEQTVGYFTCEGVTHDPSTFELLVQNHGPGETFKWIPLKDFKTAAGDSSWNPTGERAFPCVLKLRNVDGYRGEILGNVDFERRSATVAIYMNELTIPESAPEYTSAFILFKKAEAAAATGSSLQNNEWVVVQRGYHDLPKGAVVALNRPLNNNEPKDMRVAYVARWKDNGNVYFGRAHLFFSGELRGYFPFKGEQLEPASFEILVHRSDTGAELKWIRVQELNYLPLGGDCMNAPCVMKLDGIVEDYEGEILGHIDVRRGVAHFAIYEKEECVVHTHVAYAAAIVLCEVPPPLAEDDAETPPSKRQCLQ